MLFTSYSFIAFLAVVILLYYVFPKKARWTLLLVASCAFYAFADYRYLFFIAVTALSAYFAALRLERLNNTQKEYIGKNKDTLSSEEKKRYKEEIKKKKWRLLLLCLFLNLGILSVTKYTNFVIANINHFLSDASKLSPVDLIIPMGISFYTFQTLSYVIDVYRAKTSAQHNFFRLFLFVSFFPQLVQGPISRYGDLSETLYEGHSFSAHGFSMGLMRVLWGYFKKVVIADRIITGVTSLIGSPEQYKGVYVFIATMFYAFELYCDFTGGIDITIGIAEMMGIKVAENFNLPYFSKNIKEYWNRWHITMGTWFTDYIFYPISVCGPMLKLSKWSRQHLGQNIGKRVTVYLSSLAVWLATGIWHGAAWNFIVWGLMNYVVIMASQEMEPLYARFHKRFNVSGKPLYEVFQIIRTVLLMSFIRMFDCYRNVPLTFRMVGTVFTTFNFSAFTDGSLLKIGLTGADYIVLLAGFVIVLSVSLVKVKVGNVREYVYESSNALFYVLAALLLVMTVVFGAYGVGYDSAQFIYNQF